MSDDIVTRLRDLREVLMGNPIMAREVQEAMDEIQSLRKLVSELLPYMLNDMEQGISLGYTKDHIEEAPCPDCQWFEDSTLWKKRVDAGEFKDFI